jgi:hypothetical protein
MRRSAREADGNRNLAGAFEGLSGKKGRRMMRRLGVDPENFDDRLPPGF